MRSPTTWCRPALRWLRGDSVSPCFSASSGYLLSGTIGYMSVTYRLHVGYMSVTCRLHVGYMSVTWDTSAPVRLCVPAPPGPATTAFPASHLPVPPSARQDGRRILRAARAPHHLQPRGARVASAAIRRAVSHPKACPRPRMAPEMACPPPEAAETLTQSRPRPRARRVCWPSRNHDSSLLCSLPEARSLTLEVSVWPYWSGQHGTARWAGTAVSGAVHVHHADGISDALRTERSVPRGRAWTLELRSDSFSYLFGVTVGVSPIRERAVSPVSSSVRARRTWLS